MTRMKKGRVSLVGAGPGDPGLITVKGLERLKEADVVVFDRLIGTKQFFETKEGCEVIYVGKSASHHILEQDKINELLYNYAVNGNNVVRLKGGDPYVFGRGGEEAEYLVKRDIEVEIVPGITSATAGLAYAGVPVTHREIASSFHVITGHRKNNEPDTTDYSTLARLSGTLIFLMGLSNLKNIQAGLLSNGMKEETPVAVISQATTPKQKTVVSTLKEIAQTMKIQPVPSPALVVVGEVVNLRKNLSFFEKKPLFSKSIVVTRPKEDNCELSKEFYEMGANVIALPMIKIEKTADDNRIKEVLSSFSQFKYVIFMSKNGVRLFFETMFALSYDARIFSGKIICAIGKKTAEVLLNYGLCADIAPLRESSEGLWDILSPLLNKEDNALLVRAKNGRKYLSDELSKKCSLTEIFPYETKKVKAEAEILSGLLKNKQVDAITFTSPSTVTNFLSYISAEELKESDVYLFSIGESTTKAIVDAGLRVYAESEKADVRLLARAVKNAIYEGEWRE